MMRHAWKYVECEERRVGFRKSLPIHPHSSVSSASSGHPRYVATIIRGVEK
jgi:hypothetical protein